MTEPYAVVWEDGIREFISLREAEAFARRRIERGDTEPSQIYISQPGNKLIATFARYFNVRENKYMISTDHQTLPS